MMEIIKVAEEVQVVRKQILVVEVETLMRTQEKEELRRSITEQMKTGLVILPCNIKAKTVDADCVLMMERRLT